jgi:hypothetical protein
VARFAYSILLEFVSMPPYFVFVHPTARTSARFWRTHLWDEAVAFSPPFAALECLCVGAAAFITGSDDA